MGRGRAHRARAEGATLTDDATIRALERDALAGDVEALARFAAALERTGALDALQRDLEAFVVCVRGDARLHVHTGTRGRVAIPLDLASLAARVDVVVRAPLLALPALFLVLACGEALLRR